MKSLVIFLFTCVFVAYADAASTGKLTCETTNQLSTWSELVVKWDSPFQKATELYFDLTHLNIKKHLNGSEFTSQIQYNVNQPNLPLMISIDYRPTTSTELKSLMLFVSPIQKVNTDGSYYAFGRLFFQGSNDLSFIEDVRCRWYQY